MQAAMSMKSAVVERAVSWLTLPGEIVGHLFFAAAEIGQVQVDLASETVGAVLAFPHQHSNSVDLLFQAPMPGLRGAGVARVRYHHAGNSYEFITKVAGVADGRRLRLELPNAISQVAGRGAERFRVRRNPHFQVILEREDGTPIPQQIHDLSTTGASIVYRPARLTLAEGDQLLGTLALPQDQRVPVLLEVRHTRADASGMPVSVAGCVFLGISPWGRSLLAQALAALGVH